MQDYLFHSEELPQSIEIDIGGEGRELIQSIVTSWRVGVLPSRGDDQGLSQLYDMFRAYKFWFNPNRLIDAAMILQQRFANSDRRTAADGSFYQQQMRVLYRQLTTTECLDFYGYFTNKDSNYLLRTLRVVKSKQVLSWLPALTATEHEVITQISDFLECVLNALRDELAARRITTAPSAHELIDKEFTPGHRNRLAVTRAIALYIKEALATNPNIEQLFNALAADHKA